MIYHRTLRAYPRSARLSTDPRYSRTADTRADRRTTIRPPAVTQLAAGAGRRLAHWIEFDPASAKVTSLGCSEPRNVKEGRTSCLLDFFLPSSSIHDGNSAVRPTSAASRLPVAPKPVHETCVNKLSRVSSSEPSYQNVSKPRPSCAVCVFIMYKRRK